MTATDALGAGTTAFSISGWVNLAVTPSGYDGIFMSRTQNWGLAAESTHFDFRFDNPGAGGGSAGLDTAEGTATVGAWNHLAITWTSDGVTSTGNTYLNGELQSTTTSSTTVFLEDPVEWFIGADNNRRVVADLDDISVWRRALSAEDIASIHSNGRLGVGIGTTPPADPQITSITVEANGDVSLTWDSSGGGTGSYSVIFNADLSAPIANWLDANDSVPSGGSTTSVTIPAAVLPANAERLFFRVRLNPLGAQ